MKFSVRNNRGQGAAVQYATLFFVVVAFVTAMSVYVKRAVQGRIRGAREYMFNEVRAVYQTNAYNIVGELHKEYEPYYADTDLERDSIAEEIHTLKRTLPSSQTGIYKMQYGNYETRTRSVSIQDSPKAAP